MARKKKRARARGQHAAELPKREAMSLIGGSIMGGSFTPDLMGGAMPDTGGTDTTGTAPPAASPQDLADATQRIAAEEAVRTTGTTSGGGVNAPQGEATSSSST